MTTRGAFGRLAGVRDELVAARFSVGRMIAVAGADPAVLREAEGPLKPAQLRHCLARLELTYTLRLFAGFEGVVRDYWAAARLRPVDRRVQMQTLLNRVGAIRKVPPAVTDDAHSVREYRNGIVHLAGRGVMLTFDQCKSRLGFVAADLPPTW